MVGNACDSALEAAVHCSDRLQLVPGENVKESGLDVRSTVDDDIRPRRTEIPGKPDHLSLWEARHSVAHHGCRGTLVPRDDLEAGTQRMESTRIKAGWTDERQRCDPSRMRLREVRNIRGHGRREVSASDSQMVEDLCKTVSHRKICFCCHPLTSSI